MKESDSSIILFEHSKLSSVSVVLAINPSQIEAVAMLPIRFPVN